MVPDPAALDLLVPTLKQTQRSEDVIVDMLKYTQKDLDSALESAHKQARETYEHVACRCQGKKGSLASHVIILL